jgi:hypothetical protein
MKRMGWFFVGVALSAALVLMFDFLASSRPGASVDVISTAP